MPQHNGTCPACRGIADPNDYPGGCISCTCPDEGPERSGWGALADLSQHKPDPGAVMARYITPEQFRGEYEGRFEDREIGTDIGADILKAVHHLKNGYTGPAPEIHFMDPAQRDEVLEQMRLKAYYDAQVPATLKGAKGRDA